MEANIHAFQAPNQTSEVSHLCFRISYLKIKRQTQMLQEFYILRYKTVYSVESQPTFRRNISPPSSGSKQETSGKALLVTWFRDASLLCLFFDAENGGNMFLRNVC
jgi:hypothetical protein